MRPTRIIPAPAKGVPIASNKSVDSAKNADYTVYTNLHKGEIKVFEVQSDVPVPVGSTRGAKPKYPFGKMKVGDSFLVPPEGNMNSVRAAAHSWGRVKGQRFSTHTQPCGSMRVWRIE